MHDFKSTKESVGSIIKKVQGNTRNIYTGSSYALTEKERIALLQDFTSIQKQYYDTISEYINDAKEFFKRKKKESWINSFIKAIKLSLSAHDIESLKKIHMLSALVLISLK